MAIAAASMPVPMVARDMTCAAEAGLPEARVRSAAVVNSCVIPSGENS